MKGVTQKLEFGTQVFELSRSEKINSAESKAAYAECAKAIDLSRDALFIKRNPISFRPLDPAHPEHGYVSDDDPDSNELWRIKECSLSDSVSIATTLLDCPSQASFRNPAYGRTEILPFLRTLAGFNDLTLDYISEDLLGFRFFRGTSAPTRSEFDKIMTFNKEAFGREEDAEVPAWRWQLFSREKKFSIGGA